MTGFAQAPAPTIQKFLMPVARLASADLFAPTALGAGKEARFRAQLILDLSDDATADLAEEFLATCEMLWRRASRDTGQAPLTPASLGDSFNRGGRILDGFQGNLVVQASTPKAEPPTLIGHKGEIITTDDGSLYPGATVFAILKLSASTKGSRPGVYAALRGVKHLRHGDHIGWATKASAITADDFEAPVPARAH